MHCNYLISKVCSIYKKNNKSMYFYYSRTTIIQSWYNININKGIIIYNIMLILCHIMEIHNINVKSNYAILYEILNGDDKESNYITI